MFLMPKDLENMTVNGLISLVAITRLGILPQLHFKIARRYNGSMNIYMSLGTIIVTLALFLLLLLLPLLLPLLLLTKITSSCSVVSITT
jgi:hypothetical protein